MQTASSRRAGNVRASAFTILEILLVLALLVILTGLAWPVLENQITASEMPESAGKMRDLLFLARSEAALEHRPCRIRFEQGQQQPHIEYEPDPILRPDEWEPVRASWAQDFVLLGDVQVNEIRPGRPIFLQPVSEDEDMVQDSRGQSVDAAEAGGVDNTVSRSSFDQSREGVDEKRPPIVFEPDGSTSWATLILSEQPLDKELSEEQNQVWVILDGRTGLAYTRDKMTKDELGNPDLYVAREKLEMPLDANSDNLAFNINSGTQDAAGGDDGSGSLTGGKTTSFTGSASGAAAGAGANLGDLQGAANDLMNGGKPGSTGGQTGDQSGATPRSGTRGSRGSRQTRRANAANAANNAGDTGDLQKKLQNTNLSEQERKNIENALGGHRTPGRGTSRGGTKGR